MPYKIRTRDEHFLNDGSPKRILALDGGGLRGILTLSYLAEIESILATATEVRKTFDSATISI
jgi:patatin-like phospholipase/acyl hydrolase